jgi:hypothetical protein
MVGLDTEKKFRRRPIKGFLLHPAASIGFLITIFYVFLAGIETAFVV